MIDTSSVYNIEQELAGLPDKQDKATKVRAQAIKEVDILQMEFDILIAEIVTEICNKKEIKTVSGKSEIRKVDVLLDIRYKRKRKMLIKATENKNILDSAYFNLNKRFDAVIELYRNAKKQMYDNSIVMEEGGERLSTKQKSANEKMNY